MNIICLKWGDKYSHIEVNRLYKMCLKYFKDDFTTGKRSSRMFVIYNAVGLLTLKLKKDLDFYIEVSNKAKRLYKKEFTKEKMLKLLQDD